ncbi:MAG: hypothetical protein ABIP33_07300 [Pseudolysinimonas sp.]
MIGGLAAAGLATLLMSIAAPTSPARAIVPTEGGYNYCADADQQYVSLPVDTFRNPDDDFGSWVKTLLNPDFKLTTSYMEAKSCEQVSASSIHVNSWWAPAGADQGQTAMNGGSSIYISLFDCTTDEPVAVDRTFGYSAPLAAGAEREDSFDYTIPATRVGHSFGVRIWGQGSIRHFQATWRFAYNAEGGEFGTDSDCIPSGSSPAIRPPSNEAIPGPGAAGVIDKNGDYHLFAINSNYHLEDGYHHGGAWTWSDLGGSVVGTPAVTYNAATGRYDVFAAGTNGQLYQQMFLNGAWGGWHSLGHSNFRTGVSAVLDRSGHYHVFAANTYDHLEDGYYNGSYWVWHDLGGQVVGTPAVTYNAASNRYDLFAAGTNGAMYQQTYSGTAWGGWNLIGGSNFF